MANKASFSCEFDEAAYRLVSPRLTSLGKGWWKYRKDSRLEVIQDLTEANVMPCFV